MPHDEFSSENTSSGGFGVWWLNTPSSRGNGLKCEVVHSNWVTGALGSNVVKLCVWLGGVHFSLSQNETCVGNEVAWCFRRMIL